MPTGHLLSVAFVWKKLSSSVNNTVAELSCLPVSLSLWWVQTVTICMCMDLEETEGGNVMWGQKAAEHWRQYPKIIFLFMANTEPPAQTSTCYFFFFGWSVVSCFLYKSMEDFFLYNRLMWIYTSIYTGHVRLGLYVEY